MALQYGSELANHKMNTTMPNPNTQPTGRDPRADALAPKHAHPLDIRPVLKLYAVVDPGGGINHTTLDVRPDWSIKRWMDQEQLVTRIFRNTPVPSWEVYEAEGHRVVQCDLRAVGLWP